MSFLVFRRVAEQLTERLSVRRLPAEHASEVLPTRAAITSELLRLATVEAAGAQLADAAAGKVDIIVIYKIDRLTLNMPLSFAQFEREVTAERIRDKIAASSMKASTRASLPPLNGRLLAGIDSSALLNIRAIDPSREKQKRR